MSPFESDILDLVHTYYVVLFPFPKLYLKREDEGKGSMQFGLFAHMQTDF